MNRKVQLSNVKKVKVTCTGVKRGTNQRVCTTSHQGPLIDDFSVGCSSSLAFAMISEFGHLAFVATGDSSQIPSQ